MGKKAIAPPPTQWLYNYIIPTETRLKNNYFPPPYQHTYFYTNSQKNIRYKGLEPYRRINKESSFLPLRSYLFRSQENFPSVKRLHFTKGF
jgi:hypothetical protein